MDFAPGGTYDLTDERPLLRWLAYGFQLFVLLIKAAGRRLPERPMDTTGLIVVGLFAALGLFVLTVALLVRRASCGRRVLIKTMPEPPFPSATRQASDISAGRFQCMYCGQRYVLKAGADVT